VDEWMNKFTDFSVNAEAQRRRGNIDIPLFCTRKQIGTINLVALTKTVICYLFYITKWRKPVILFYPKNGIIFTSLISVFEAENN
jgi:hypothetical protein